MNREFALVTGGNSGIGLECARQLARDGRHVLLASRNRDASAAVVREIERESGAGSASELGLDLGSLESVRSFAKEITAQDPPVHSLVCNAGLQMNDGPRLTPDGFETTFAVNHLGHFLLTNLLLARPANRAPTRIVVVASGVHDPDLFTGMPKAEIADLETLAASGCAGGDAYDGRLAYVNSKLCNLWFTYELVRRMDRVGLSSDARPISVNAFEPGLVPGSGLARDYPPALKFIWDNLLPLLARGLSPFIASINTADVAGQAMARVTQDPALERTSGKYFPSHSKWREAPSSTESYDAVRAAALWDASVDMAGLRPGESPLLAS